MILTILAILGCILICTVGFFIMCFGALGSSLSGWFGGMVLMIAGGFGAFHIFNTELLGMTDSPMTLLLSFVCGFVFFIWAFWSTFYKHS